MNRHRYPNSAPTTGQKTQLVLAYQELGKELNSTHLKVVGNYTLGRVIGEGSFGKVHLGVHRLTGTRVAVKHIPKSASPPLLTREIHHHRRLHHPNVVQLYEVIATEHSIWLITELCAGGELFDYLVEKTRFTESETRRIFGQICLGLGYVHREGVVHRDLKLENVLLDERCNPKLADFGFGREYEQRKLLDTFCGTTGYAAPEMLAGRKYLGQEVDIWSLGIIFYTLLTGSLPFDDDDEDVMKSLIMMGKYDVPAFLSNEARDLISKILQQEPMARPSIENILSHPWFTTPPCQHTIGETDFSSRPSTIAEEEQQSLTTSPRSTRSFRLSNQHVYPATSQMPCDHSSKQKQDIISESDTSESSSKESDLGMSRSVRSSPVTSEDLSPPIHDVTVLDPSPVLVSDQPSASRAHSILSAKSKPPTLVLQHRNNSNSTIRKTFADPHSTPCPRPRIASSSAAISRASSGLVHDESENTLLNEVEEPSCQSGQSPEHSQSHKSDKVEHRSSSSSSSTTVPSEVTSTRQRRPLSIIPSFPSSIIHHPQIRTPSRTKRRSVGSTMSERMDPLEDLDQAGLAMSLHAVPSASSASTPVNNALFSSMSMTYVIDYLGALKITRQTPMMSEEDMGLVKSLSSIGFDTGQMMHSVQSNACDSSGAMWWLLKRKLDKQAADREYAERSSARISATIPVTKLPFAPSSTSQAAQEPFHQTPVSISTSSTVTPGLLRSSLDRPLPASFPGQLRQPSSHDELRVPAVTPRKLKPALSSSKTIEPLLNPVKIVGKTAESNVPDPPKIVQRSDQTPQKQPLPSITSDDAFSSTSSVTIEESNSEKDRSILCDSSRVKHTPENRKRSHSVSMLQRATHALASKKLLDDGFTKQAKARFKDSLFVDGNDKSLTEKLSKKDLKAKEKESKVIDDMQHKSGSISSRSGLFSRKIIAPLAQPPQIPLLLTPDLLASTLGSTTPERNASQKAQLESPEPPRPSASMPSSPRKSMDACPSSRRGSDPTSVPLPSQPGMSTSTSASTITPASLLALSNLDKRPETIASTDAGDSFSTVAPEDLSPALSSDAISSLIKAKAKGAAQANQTGSSPSKGGRTKGSNLFSSFRFWFNEDRRRRKRKTIGPATYTGSPHSYTTASPGGICSSPVSTGSRTANSDASPLSVRLPGGSVPIRRQTSSASHRSSLQSNRRISQDMAQTRRAIKRRSDSSRASGASLTGSRSPTSELDSTSHHVVGQLSGDGSRSKSRRFGHHRQGSNGSANSRRSTVAVHHISHPGFLRRTPSSSTTVRRITATTSSATGSRQRHSKTQSGASSARTSMSSEDGSQPRPLTDELRLHSPINVHDVEETIEEEDGDEDVESGQTGEDQAEARELALKKLSGGHGQKMKKEAGDQGSTASRNNTTTTTTTTIFLAYKPSSVFGTPTQAFFGGFGRSSASPVATKFSNPVYAASFYNPLGLGAGGGGGRHKIRDVFAAKQQQGSDGEWVDVESDDDVCTRYGGGLGQTVHRRSDVAKGKKAESGLTSTPISISTSGSSLALQEAPSTPTLAKGSRPAGFTRSLLGEGRYAGIKGGGIAEEGPGSVAMSQRNAIGARFNKTVAIVEEEEEEEE